MTTIPPTMLATAPTRVQAASILDALVYAYAPQSTPGTVGMVYASPFHAEIEIRAAWGGPGDWTFLVSHDGMIVDQGHVTDFPSPGAALDAFRVAFVAGWDDDADA